VDKEQLIAAIRVLTDYKGVTLREIEEALKIPQNSLSGMLNGSRNLAPKWQKLLMAYVEAKAEGKKEIIIPIGDAKDPVVTSAQKAKKTEVLPEIVQAPSSATAPPPGMNKAQQLRWHREQNQSFH
jgi:hypothetical protein